MNNSSSHFSNTQMNSSADDTMEFDFSLCHGGHYLCLYRG